MAASLVKAPTAALALVIVATSLPLGVFTLGAAMVSEVAPVEHRNRLGDDHLLGDHVLGDSPPLVAEALISSHAGWRGAFLVLAAVASRWHSSLVHSAP